MKGERYFSHLIEARVFEQGEGASVGAEQRTQLPIAFHIARASSNRDGWISLLVLLVPSHKGQRL